MRPDHVSVDLVEKGSNQTSTTLTHLCVKCPWQNRGQVVGDLIQMYGGASGRTIVFCETKKECNELSTAGTIKQEVRTLHGDIPQATRETTLSQFTEGKFKVLIATDVAARGLHIDDVDLVIQCEPPAGNSGRADTDTYVHRSGRTGRAGRKGVAITLFTIKQEYLISAIEQKIGHTIRRIGTPQPSDIIKGVAKTMPDALAKVHESIPPLFTEVAKELIIEYGEVEALARALAAASGYDKALTSRSLLSGSEGFVTMQFSGMTEIRTPGKYLLTH
jgi:ATP-dependent RNA helicase DDX21